MIIGPLGQQHPHIRGLVDHPSLYTLVEGPKSVGCIYNWRWEPPQIVSPIVTIYWPPFLLSDNVKRALNYVDNKPSNLDFCATVHCL